MAFRWALPLSFLSFSAKKRKKRQLPLLSIRGTAVLPLQTMAGGNFQKHRHHTDRMLLSIAL